MTLYKWSQTAASDATADSTINWAEGQAPSTVNDSARAMMAATAKYRDDVNGSLTTGGTSTAYTITSNEVFDTLAHLDKNTLTITMHATSGATPTLNVDGLGAKSIRLATGATLATGALVSGSTYSVTYYNTAGEFLVHNQVAFAIPANAVVTASITDANVTLAKIVNTAASRILGNPTGSPAAPSEISVTGPLAFSGTALTLGATTTAHGVALFEGASAMGNTGAGTVGQALVSNGASSDPSFQSGGWVLLNTLTASSSATLQDTTSLTSAYTDYMIVFNNVLPATNSTGCELQFHSGGIYQSANYFNAYLAWNSTTTGNGGSSGFINITQISVLGNNAGYGVSGTLTIYGPVNTTSGIKNTVGNFTWYNGSAIESMQVGAFWNNTAAIDGFQVLMGSGNIASGTVKVYGRL